MKKATEELPLATAHESAIAAHEPTIPELMRLAVTSGDPEKNIGVLERLVAMQERKEAKDAEREYAVAFHKLQEAMPGVQALDEVPDKHGGVRYTFASYERIMAQVRPLLISHGFSVTFDSEFKDERLVMRCTLMHVGGHSRTTTQYMRVSAPYGANDTQADGATSSMAKRYALCCALNIVIERDTDGVADARNEGAPISYEQAQTLREMVTEAKADSVKFLKYAGAATFEEIGVNRYQSLFRELQDRIQNPNPVRK